MLDEEAPSYFPNRNLSAEWPQSGEIVFKDVEMRYRTGLPLVLKSFNLHVKGGERIGVVGRTGAGKSSIMSTLFRLVELSGGAITIDGVDISTVGLADLRSRLAIIPQDPTLFRGTVRSNLDPFNAYTDLQLWSALRQADLIGSEVPSSDAPIDVVDNTQAAPVELEKKSGTLYPGVSPQETSVPVSSGRFGLDSPVEEEGLNFSLGQRQLMALARALVRNAQIIVCDEATSSVGTFHSFPQSHVCPLIMFVDMATDDKIQLTMKTAFEGRTVLCIAHRLKTILNYDRIVVMDKGEVTEVGTPIELFRSDGIFTSMCNRSKITEADFV